MLSLVAIVVPGIVTATEFIVGDEDGWQSGIDYGDWTVGKVFQVGDKLGNESYTLLLIYQVLQPTC